MHKRLPLRLRIFLFFAALALGGVAIVIGALWFGFSRGGATPQGYITAAVLAAFGIIALTTGIWFLFDENVAKPIEKLASHLRARAHANVSTALDAHASRYLGDLAPAVAAVSARLTDKTLETAATVASETARLEAEKDKLTSLLSDIPIAMVLVNNAHQIVLYDAQAAAALAQICPLRLNATIFDYFTPESLKAAYDTMRATGAETPFTAHGTAHSLDFDARLKPLSSGTGYLLLIEQAHALIAPTAARPVTYDFALFNRDVPGDIAQTKLADLSFMVFDTETTGLLPHRDDIVQIGALRLVNGRIVPGEVVDQLVNPGRPIPPASTRVHGISDAMVADAPPIADVIAPFHAFARGCVIVAHNAPFDMAFLKRYGTTAGLAWDHPIVDTVLLSAVIYGTTEVHTLDALCQRLGVTIPENLRHTALGDAQATAEVLCKLLPMLHGRGIETLQDLFRETRKHSRLLQDMN